MTAPDDKAMATAREQIPCSSCEYDSTPDCPFCLDDRIELAHSFESYAAARVAEERERVKALLAPYAWHAYNCPKMNDHACTCGMEAVRMELWGKPGRPAEEPFVRLHEDYAKSPKKVRDRMAKRNAT